MPIQERKMPKWQLVAMVAAHVYPTLGPYFHIAIDENVKQAVEIARKIVEKAAK